MTEKEEKKTASIPMCIWTVVCVAASFLYFIILMEKEGDTAIVKGLLVSGIPLIILLISGRLAPNGAVTSLAVILGLIAIFALGVCSFAAVTYITGLMDTLPDFVAVLLVIINMVILGISYFRLMDDTAVKRMMVVIFSLLLMAIDLIFVPNYLI